MRYLVCFFGRHGDENNELEEGVNSKLLSNNQRWKKVEVGFECSNEYLAYLRCTCLIVLEQQGTCTICDN
jgi:hypothetical protein